MMHVGLPHVAPIKSILLHVWITDSMLKSYVYSPSVFQELSGLGRDRTKSAL